MSRIAVQLLIGQNVEPFLEYAIRSVYWADYFTVVNTSPKSLIGQANKATVDETLYDLGVEQPLRYAELEPDKDGLFSFAGARNLSLGLIDRDDYVLVVDSDDVHYPVWEQELKHAIAQGADSVTAYFYHLMVYKNIFQYTQPREIVYRNYEDTRWIQGVHERLVRKALYPVVSDYHYCHYGYVKPQREVFKRWKMYSDIDGDFHHYDGQDPDNIITDRISVSKPLPVQHPPVIKEFMESYPECPPLLLRGVKESVPVEKVGLILFTYNDEYNLNKCLKTLAQTHKFPNFEVMAVDLGSTDSSVDTLTSYEDVIDMSVWEAGSLLPLAQALNIGLDHFRVRHDIQYIGWIHPDMVFDDPNWLMALWKTLERYPKIGKICAANTRDPLPKELIAAHEQCYIIRKDIVNKIGLFDEGYQGIGGYEDWDYNKRIMMHDGYQVMVTPESKVYHEGMATRSKRDTTPDQIANSQYYFNKWKTYNAPV